MPNICEPVIHPCAILAIPVSNVNKFECIWLLDLLVGPCHVSTGGYLSLVGSSEGHAA